MKFALPLLLSLSLVSAGFAQAPGATGAKADRALDEDLSPLDATGGATKPKPASAPVAAKPVTPAAPPVAPKPAPSTAVVTNPGSRPPLMKFSDASVAAVVAFLEKRLGQPIAYFGTLTATFTADYSNMSAPAMLAELATNQNLVLVSDAGGYAMVPALGRYRSSSDWTIRRALVTDITADAKLKELKTANPGVFAQLHKVASSAPPVIIAVYPADQHYVNSTTAPRPAALPEGARRTPADKLFDAKVAAERARLLKERAVLASDLSAVP